jgi:ankyrin repeat protein
MSTSPPPEVVLVAHGDLARLKTLLDEDPSQLNLMYTPWKEDPLAAASHVGNRPIAEYLLELGAPLRITTAAMLGRTEDVRRFLEADASLANATGAHDISLLYHAAMSGVVPIVDMIVEKGGSTAAAGHALLGAAQFGHLEMVEWLLAHGADPNVPNFQGKTALDIANEIERPDIAARIQAAGGKAAEAATE